MRVGSRDTQLRVGERSIVLRDVVPEMYVISPRLPAAVSVPLDTLIRGEFTGLAPIRNRIYSDASR